MAAISDDERLMLAERVREQRLRVHESKSAAYRAAGLNAATWDRIESGMPVRDDRLAAALKVLWPESGGDWRRVDLGSALSSPTDSVQKTFLEARWSQLVRLASEANEPLFVERVGESITQMLGRVLDDLPLIMRVGTPRADVEALLDALLWVYVGSGAYIAKAASNFDDASGMLDRLEAARAENETRVTGPGFFSVVREAAARDYISKVQLVDLPHDADADLVRDTDLVRDEGVTLDMPQEPATPSPAGDPRGDSPT